MPTRKPEGPMAELARIKKKSGNVLLGELEKAELAEFEAESDRRADVLHPSEMAKEDWCYRSSYYRIKHNRYVKDDHFSPQMQRIFATGNEAHTKWQRRMRATGKLWGDWQCLICKTWTRGSLEPSIMEPAQCLVTGISHIWEYKEVSLVSDDCLVQGHEDGGMDDYLVEIKTIGTGTVRHDDPDLLKAHYKELVEGGKIYDIDSLYKAITKPFPTHTRQANIYIWLAQQMGLPFTKVRFLYELKHNSATKEFVIVPSERIMKPILTGIETVKYALAEGVPPECNQKDENGENCKQCTAYEEAIYGAKQESSAPGGPDGNGPRGRARGRAGHDAPETGGAAPRRRVTRRGVRSPEAGDRTGRVGTAPGGDAAESPRGRDIAERPGTDGPVHPPVPVDEVPERSGSGGNGRRVLRRKGRGAGEDA